jgi:hypothetical protein
LFFCLQSPNKIFIDIRTKENKNKGGEERTTDSAQQPSADGITTSEPQNLTLLKFAKVDVLFLMFFCLQSPNKMFIDLRTKEDKDKGEEESTTDSVQQPSADGFTTSEPQKSDSA